MPRVAPDAAIVLLDSCVTQYPVEWLLLRKLRLHLTVNVRIVEAILEGRKQRLGPDHPSVAFPPETTGNVILDFT